MIDMHCHLLPGVDDGAKTMEQAIELAQIAVQNGITHAVLTPHITPGRYDNSPENLAPVFARFSTALKTHNIPLQVALAAEMRIDPLIMEMAEAGTLPYVGEYEGHKLLLLEFPHAMIPPGSLELVDWLMRRQIRPLIAHPERNQSIIRNLLNIEPYIKAGCLLQLTAGSLTGIFGPGPKTSALKLIQRGWIKIVASDAHNNRTRLPEIESARSELEKILGKETSWLMVREWPMQMTSCHFKFKPA